MWDKNEIFLQKLKRLRANTWPEKREMSHIIFFTPLVGHRLIHRN